MEHRAGYGVTEQEIQNASAFRSVFSGCRSKAPLDRIQRTLKVEYVFKHDNPHGRNMQNANPDIANPFRTGQDPDNSTDDEQEVTDVDNNDEVSEHMRR